MNAASLQPSRWLHPKRANQGQIPGKKDDANLDNLTKVHGGGIGKMENWKLLSIGLQKSRAMISSKRRHGEVLPSWEWSISQPVSW